MDAKNTKKIAFITLVTFIISTAVTLTGHMIGRNISRATIESSKQEIVKELILTLYDSSNPDGQKGAVIGLSIYGETAIAPLISVLRDSALFHYSVRSLYEIGENAIKKLLDIVILSGDYDQRIIACRAVNEMQLIGRSDIADKFYNLLESGRSNENAAFNSKISVLNGLLLQGISITCRRDDFRHYDFSNLDFAGSAFKRQELLFPGIGADSSNYSNSFFHFINISNGSLRKSDFSFCSIDSGLFMNCLLQGSRFEHIQLRNCGFDSSKLQNSDFNNSIIDRCDFSRSILVNTDFKNSKITNSDFSGANMSDMDITGAFIDKKTFSTMEMTYP